MNAQTTVIAAPRATAREPTTSLFRLIQSKTWPSQVTTWVTASSSAPAIRVLRPPTSGSRGDRLPATDRAAFPKETRVSHTATPASRRRNSQSTSALSSSKPNIGPVKSPWLKMFHTLCRLGTIVPSTQSKAAAALSEISESSPVTAGLTVSTNCIAPLTMVAWKLPHAPSIVEVDVAASLATSVIPRFRIA